jgi:hypothetical protein
LKDKQYYFYIHHNITILTIEGNCQGQLDKCYVIVDGAWVALSVDDVGSCCECR